MTQKGFEWAERKANKTTIDIVQIEYRLHKHDDNKFME